MITIKSFTFNPFQENTFVLYDETKEALIIDPGCYTKEEEKILENFIAQNDLRVVKLLNTHCHIDHVLGNQFVKNTYQVKLETHKVEAQQLAQVPLYAGAYGFANLQVSEVDTFLVENDKIIFGNSELDILFVPGHSPGHLAFYSSHQKFCINGDVLFKNSIGRTDLPGGDFDTLKASIQNVMYQLPEETEIFCGHGPSTTIGYEKKFNSFVKG